MITWSFLQTLGLKTLCALGMVGVVMGLSAYAVLAERKVSSWIQGRVGPNRTLLPWVGALPYLGRFLQRLGVFQPMADGLKFLFKEDVMPGHVRPFAYRLAPIVALVPALLTMVVIPFGQYTDPVSGQTVPLVLANLDVGILFFLAIASLGVYGVVLAGWAANSKYPLLGSVRACAQMISYELAMGLSLLPVWMWASGTGNESGLNLAHLVAVQKGCWTGFYQPISAFIFLVALFAETNRLPFDMAESETDLVGGFHTEYGSFKFGLFFVAEYAHMIVGSALFTVLFWGGWHFLPGLADPWPSGLIGALCSVGWFLAKTLFWVFCFIWVRWTLPRYRYDQVMHLGWQILLPLALGNLFFYTLFIALWDSSGFSAS